MPLAAVARGASLIEKHFTLDKNDDGPDHKLSADPSEMAELVRLSKIVASCIGSGEKLVEGEATQTAMSVYHFNNAGSRWTNYRRIYVRNHSAGDRRSFRGIYGHCRQTSAP